MMHQINIAAEMLHPGMNWIDLQDHGIEIQGGDTLEISIQGAQSPMEHQALRFTVPKGATITGIQIPVSPSLPEEAEVEQMWDEATLRRLKSEDRPALSFNFIRGGIPNHEQPPYPAPRSRFIPSKKTQPWSRRPR